MTDFIRFGHEAGVATITLARGSEGNRLTNAMAERIVAALGAAADARLIVLAAEGADFCIGRDMQPPAPGAGVSALDVVREDAGPMIALYDAFRRRRQPVLCAVEGRAWGIGLVLAALADLTLVSAASTFRLRELERGIPPCIAMAPLIDRMPTKALAHLVLAADEVNAATALACGIASRVVPAGTTAAATAEVAARVLSFPDEAVQAVKQYLASAPRQREADAALYGAALLGNVLSSR